MSVSISATDRPSVAIVVQRYGEEITGGAERAARHLAERLIPFYDVHVITTCAHDFTTWADVYPAGDSTLNGVNVHRFSVDAPRDWPAAQEATPIFFDRESTESEQMEWIKEQGPWSTTMQSFIDASRNRFVVFIFFSFSYAPAVVGIPQVASKAILVPAAHDEPTLYLTVLRQLFLQPQIIACFTAAERALIADVTAGKHAPLVVGGLGIDPLPTHRSAARFRQRYRVHDPFVLYVGRVAAGKNVPELIQYFIDYKRVYPSSLKLLLIGPQTIELPSHPDIVFLGYLPEEDKYDGYEAAEWVIMPSQYESLSITALESWLSARPMLVNGRCEVLRMQCRQSHGGLYYMSFAEFVSMMNWLRHQPDARRHMGQRGRAFVRRNYRWDVVLARYRAMIEWTRSEGDRI